jgi:hypothetical protein
MAEDITNGVMWHCSLCNLDLGEISAIGEENDHPTCPYCHGVVEEERANPAEDFQVQARVKWIDLRSEVFAKASERSVDRIFEILAKSIESSPYSEYKEDILKIVKDAFEPVSRLAQGDIARIFIENCIIAGTGSDRRTSDRPLISI